MLLQGQEFLQDGWFRDDRPLAWHLATEYPGILRLYQDLIALRRNLGGLTRGLSGQGLLVFHVNDADNVVAFHRWFDHGPGDDVVVIANMGAADRTEYRVGMPTAGCWHVRLNTDSELYGPMGQNAGPAALDAQSEPADGLPASATLTVPAYSVLVLSQDTSLTI